MIFWLCMGSLSMLMMFVWSLVRVADKKEEFGTIYISYVDDIPVMKLEIEPEMADDLVIHKFPKRAIVEIKAEQQTRE